MNKLGHDSLAAALEAVGYEGVTPTSREEVLGRLSLAEEALKRLEQHQPGKLLLEPVLFWPISPTGFSIFKVHIHRAGYPLLKWWGRDGIGLPVQGQRLQDHLIDINRVIEDLGYDAVPRAAFWVNARIAKTKAGKPCLRQHQPSSGSSHSILADISLPVGETLEGDCEIIKTLRQSASAAEYDMDTFHLVVARPGFRMMWGEKETNNFGKLLKDKWGFDPLPS